MGDFVLSRFRRLGPRSRPVLFAKAGYGLHAMTTSVGYEVRTPPDRYDWHGLRRGASQFALLQHTLAGTGRLVYEGRPYTVTPGQTMLLYFPHDNRYWLPSDREAAAENASAGGGTRRWEFFYLCVNGSEVMRAWRSAVDNLGPVCTLSSATVDAAAGACLEVLRGEVAAPGRASSLAYDLAMRVLDEAMPRAPLLDERPTREPAIQRAIVLCRQRLTDPDLGVAHLAEAAGLSRFHFTRRFADSEGTPPGEFILRERMKEAVRLLQSTDESVKAVARRAGFHDPNYFAKAFRRSFGVSPREFRRSGMY